MEDYYSRAQSGQRDVQTTAGGCRFQLPGEMFQIGIWCITKELEEIVMETVSVGSVDDHIRDSQDFEEQPGSLTLIGSY